MRGHQSIRARSATGCSRGRPATRAGSKPMKITGLPNRSFSSRTLATRWGYSPTSIAQCNLLFYTRKARWYDSGAGRFVARSIFPPMMEGAYIPFNNNPLSWADANGLMSSQEPTGITADIMLCFAAIATKNPLWQSICKDALKDWLNLPEYEEIIESLDDASPHPASRPHCYEDKCDPNNHKPPAPGKPGFPRGGGQFGPILIFPIPGTCPGCYDFPCWGGIGCSKCGWRPGGMT